MNADGFKCGDLLGGILHIVSHFRACALFKISTIIPMNLVAAKNTQCLIGNSSQINIFVRLNYDKDLGQYQSFLTARSQMESVLVTE